MPTCYIFFVQQMFKKKERNEVLNEMIAAVTGIYELQSALMEAQHSKTSMVQSSQS